MQTCFALGLLVQHDYHCEFVNSIMNSYEGIMTLLCEESVSGSAVVVTFLF